MARSPIPEAVSKFASFMLAVVAFHGQVEATERQPILFLKEYEFTTKEKDGDSTADINSFVYFFLSLTQETVFSLSRLGRKLINQAKPADLPVDSVHLKNLNRAPDNLEAD